MNILQIIQNSKKTNELYCLKRSLADYGLSPTEWQIKPEQGEIYIIENCKEPKFYFRGKTKFKKGRRIWGSITLWSI